MAATRSSVRSSIALYKSEDEIARLVLGDDLKQWKALAAVLEREGLPRIDPMTGRRFWPAVERFFFRRHGLSAEIVPSRVDGVEQWQ